MGNNCCTTETSTDPNNEFKANNASGNNETRHSANKNFNSNNQNESDRNFNKVQVENLRPIDHLPQANCKDYIIQEYGSIKFPPQLTNEAYRGEHDISNIKFNHKQNQDAIYPSSSNPYLISQTKEIYLGQFFNRKPHGFGEIYTPTYDANTPNSGLETVKHGNTVANSGAFSNNNAIKDTTYTNDPSQLKNMSYIKYGGNFKNGTKCGLGYAIYPDGSVYVGEWLNNLPNGKGKLESLKVSGKEEFYEGDWKAGQMSGVGHQKWADGTTYKGGFLSGKKDGHGVFSWPDGNLYEGSYKNDLREGFGKFKW